MQNDLKNGPGDSKIGFFHATLKRSGDVSSSEDEFVPNSDSRYIIHPSLDIVNEPVRPLLFTISSRSLYQGKVFL